MARKASPSAKGTKGPKIPRKPKSKMNASDQQPQQGARNVLSRIGNGLKTKISPDLDTNVDSLFRPELVKFVQSLDGGYKSTKNDTNQRYLKADEAALLVQLRRCKLVSIDIELWEARKRVLTEVGIAMYNPSYQRYSIFPHVVCSHYVIKENLQKNNGRYVPDAKHNCISTESTILTMSQAKQAVKSLFEELGPETIIVGHGVKGDLTMLSELGFEIPETVKVIDTQTLWFSIMGTHNNVKSSLSYVLEKLQIPHAFMHNGCNDAYYTLLACLQLCSPEFRNNAISRKKLEYPEMDEEEKRRSHPLPYEVTFKAGQREEVIATKMRTSKSHRNPAQNTFYPMVGYDSNVIGKRLDEFLGKQ